MVFGERRPHDQTTRPCAENKARLQRRRSLPNSYCRSVRGGAAVGLHLRAEERARYSAVKPLAKEYLPSHLLV